jgi:hypothetical protein
VVKESTNRRTPVSQPIHSIKHPSPSFPLRRLDQCISRYAAFVVARRSIDSVRSSFPNGVLNTTPLSIREIIDCNVTIISSVQNNKTLSAGQAGRQSRASTAGIFFALCPGLLSQIVKSSTGHPLFSLRPQPLHRFAPARLPHPLHQLRKTERIAQSANAGCARSILSRIPHTTREQLFRYFPVDRDLSANQSSARVGWPMNACKAIERLA